MKLRKSHKDRKAYYWASKLLPAHIEELKKKLKNSADDGDQMSLKVKINQAEEELQIIEEECERI